MMTIFSQVGDEWSQSTASRRRSDLLIGVIGIDGLDDKSITVSAKGWSQTVRVAAHWDTLLTTSTKGSDLSMMGTSISGPPKEKQDWAAGV